MEHNYKIRIKTLDNDSNIKEYTQLLEEGNNHNMYYSFLLIKPFRENYGELNYFLFEKQDEPIIIMPFIQRKVICQEKVYPYFDVISPWGYGGPIFNGEVTEEDITAFWQHVDDWYAEHNVITEFIRFSLNGNHRNYSGTLVKTLSNVKGRLLDNFEDQWKAFHAKVRNNYRKAAQYNLDFKLFQKEEITKEQIKIFNNIYVDTMTRNNADNSYYFSNSYFEDLILSNIDNFSIAVVYHEDTPISVELIISYQETIYAFLGGTNAEYFSYRPNDFLRVKVVEWAISANKKYYVLGGGIKDGDGLLRSKKALFPKDELAIFYTGRKIVNPEVYEELCISVDKEKYESITEENFGEHFFPLYRNTK